MTQAAVDPTLTPAVPPSVTPATLRLTPTIAPLPTVQATLDHSDAQALVLELLKGSSECTLPCWWGFVPGRSSMSSVEQFHAQLGSVAIEHDFRGGGGLVVIEFDDPSMQLGQYYLSGNELVDFIFVSAGSTLVRDDHQVYDDPKFQEAWRAYLLPQLVRTYGTPTAVWLKTFATAPEVQDIGHLPFSLLVYYASKGFMVEYEGETVQSDSQIELCAQKASIALWLWPPEAKMTVTEVIARGPSSAIDDFGAYRTIEEAAGMRPEDFADFYGGEGGLTNCLETPADLWS